MCGVIGVISHKNQQDLGALIALGLHNLQHRGDYSAGIATIAFHNLSRKKREYLQLRAIEEAAGFFENFHFHKGYKTVQTVFSPSSLEQLVGFMGIGQVRYPTAGYTKHTSSGETTSIQPLIASYAKIAMVHNGDVRNYHELMQALEHEGLPAGTDNDLEAIMGVFLRSYMRLNDHLEAKERIALALKEVMQQVKGTYSALAMLNDVGLVAFRDPEGRRPLFYGVKKDRQGKIIAYGFASETVALEKMLFKGTSQEIWSNGSKGYEEIPPGGMMFVSKDLEVVKQQLVPASEHFCPFEVAYFARGSSFLQGKRVKKMREALLLHMWQRYQRSPLAQRLRMHHDDAVIVPVPRTAEQAAEALAHATGIPYKRAIEKNPFSGRIFQQVTQEHREKNTILEHYIFKEDIERKYVLLVDDSLVRGTTLKRDIKYLRDLGAKEVHVFLTFPPIRHPCYHAIDFHTSEELFAHQYPTLPQMKKALGLRSFETLFFAHPKDLYAALGTKALCNECYRK